MRSYLVKPFYFVSGGIALAFTGVFWFQMFSAIRFLVAAGYFSGGR